MTKARNGIRYPESTKDEARLLRGQGLTHREIARILGTSLSVAHLWTREVSITEAQKQAIESRRNVHRMNDKEKKNIAKRLAPYQYQPIYSSEDLLEKIREFYVLNGRIPLKREFNALRIYRTHFGSWNNAIEKAGFATNPVLFAKRLHAKDGHICDSFSEKIIDDYFFSMGIEHDRHCHYGNTKFTVDFKIGHVYVEFFGLAGVQKSYDANIEKKRLLAKQLGYTLIEIYPKDMYPENKLAVILRDVSCRAAEN